MITGAVDRYKGMEITDLSQFSQSEEEFEKQLIKSLEQWEKDKIRSVQIFFNPPYCHLMNVVSRFGFYFHHASREKGGYVLLCRWLDRSTHDKIPAYADHYVGVGGAVINQKGEILLIQEVRSPEPKPWKLPGGFMDPKETISQAVEREVFEETGVKAKFYGLLGLREQLKFRYDSTDFYIVCLLLVNDDEAQEIDIKDKREVSGAQWVPLADLTSNGEAAKYRMFPNAYMFISGLNKIYTAQGIEGLK